MAPHVGDVMGRMAVGGGRSHSSRRATTTAITLGAVVLAFSFYAGDPEGTLLLGLAIAIFCAVVLALRLPLLRGSAPFAGRSLTS